MVYPQRPNGRDVMDKPQLAIATGMEGIFSRLLEKYGDYDLAYAEYLKCCEQVGLGCAILHGTSLSEATRLEDVQDRHRANLNLIGSA